uniref:tRNA(Ile)-lysidine/2-thiocytidine synthase N-terminal domain-containing protein n=1 Tax=uncultured Poseidoniia archaeon TaxID=1697135 RepID=A0A1B1TFI6_9ARCH|nr:hypothetical protein [uncultured Candidatus Thalassoarchaea sp.]
MALGHNLDDMAQSILMNLQKGEIERSVRLAPHTSSPLEGLAPRIVPLRWIPEQEIHAHAVISHLPFFHGDCPHAPGAMRQLSRGIIANLEQKLQAQGMDFYTLLKRLGDYIEKEKKNLQKLRIAHYAMK